MNRLTATLLTGAAISVLSAAPSIAGSHSHHPMLAVRTPNGAISVKGNLHYKTPVHNEAKIVSTTTVTTGAGNQTFHFTGLESTMYKHIKDLQGEVWYTVTAGGHCADYHGQIAKKGSTDLLAKIHVHTSKAHVTIYTTGTQHVKSCSGTLTFYGPTYELVNDTAKSDSFKFEDIIQYTTTYTTSSRHRRKTQKYEDIARMNWAVEID